MNKKEFLDRLTVALAPLPYARRQEIVEEFTHKFESRLSAGEAEEEICASLGSPESCAAQYLNAAQSAPPPYTQTPPQNFGYAAPQGQAPYYQQPAPQREDKTGYVVGLILTVLFLAVPFAPTAVGLILAGAILFLAAFALFPVSGLAIFGAFMIALAVLLISVAVLILYGIVALIVYLVRKISDKPGRKEAKA